MQNTLNKKSLISLFILGSLVVGGLAVLPSSLAATKPTASVKVTGKAKLVLQGTVTATTVNSLTLHIANTSKNAKIFDNKDKAIAVGSKTKITKNGRVIALNKISKGDTVKVFGIFDTKSGVITLVRWIKVIPK